MNDADLIKSLGGPTAVARLLGLELPGGSRRIHNWIKRGIPAGIKVLHPEIFLKNSGAKYRKPRCTPTPQAPAPADSDIATAAAGQGA